MGIILGGNVRRTDSILSWNGQEFLRNSTYTMSFVWHGCFVVYSDGFMKKMIKSSNMEILTLELVYN